MSFWFSWFGNDIMYNVSLVLRAGQDMEDESSRAVCARGVQPTRLRCHRGGLLGSVGDVRSGSSGSITRTSGGPTWISRSFRSIRCNPAIAGTRGAEHRLRRVGTRNTRFSLGAPSGPPGDDDEPGAASARWLADDPRTVSLGLQRDGPDDQVPRDPRSRPVRAHRSTFSKSFRNRPLWMLIFPAFSRTDAW